MNTIEFRSDVPETANQTYQRLTAKLHVALILFPLAVLGATFAGAQTTPQSPPAATPPATAPQTGDVSDQTPKFSTNADEVSLDLVVHDKKHRPVLDLKAEDLGITDEGTPVKLNGFRLVQGDSNAEHMVTLVFDRFEGPLAKSARAMADKVLKTLPTNGYYFSVMDFGGRLRLLQGFTQDRAAIDQAVTIATDNDVTRLVSTLSQGVNMSKDKKEPARVTAAEQAEKNLISIARTGADTSGRHVDTNERAKAQAVLKALEDAQLIVQDQHANRALAGILALVRSQQQITERKAIIYFTLNQIMDSGSKEMLKTIAGAATKAGVTIYTVDLDALNTAGQRSVENALGNGQQPFNGAPVVVGGSGANLATVKPVQMEGGEGVQPAASANGPTWGAAQDIAQMTDFARGNNEDPNRYREIKSPMSDLSKDTGGLYIDAQVSVKGPLNQMLQDMSTYYEASYIPPPQEYDGKFRAIDIKPLRAGLQVTAKTGYFALPPGSASGIRPFETPLLKALDQPQLPSGFKFDASILRFGDLPDGNTNALVVEVPFSGLDIKEDVHTNLFSARVIVVAQIKDTGGTVIEHFAEDIARRGALETLDRDKSMTVAMQRHFMEIPGKYVLEVAVKDNNNDKMSAQRIPFEISATQSGPALSDIVLVRKMDNFDSDADPLEPLRYENAKVTANLSGVVPRDSKSVSLFMLLHPDPKSKEPPTLEMQIIRNGTAGRRTPLPMHAAANEGTIPYLATFQTKSLAPGEYKVKATMTQGGDTSLQEIAFTVEGQPGETSASAAPAGHGGSAAPPDDTVPTLESAPDVPGQLAIAPATNPLPPPTLEEAQSLISDVRERAVGYKDGLPNFMCVEIINRSLDPSGQGRWKHRDTITEVMKYREKTEDRMVVDVDGKAPASKEPEAIRGPKSTGEFGGVLDAVFEPKAKADFKWKETDTLGTGTVQVFEYSVLKENSSFSVAGPNGLEPTVSFHGKVFVDASTRSVRRVTLVADNLPREFATRATSVSVDYDYVSINAHDYLMPVSAEVSLLEGHHAAMLNTIEFRNYKRFGSNVKILNFRAVENP